MMTFFSSSSSQTTIIPWKLTRFAGYLSPKVVSYCPSLLSLSSSINVRTRTITPPMLTRTPTLTRTHHPRSEVLGGTISLNAAFFATVLLISRIKSNATSYAFVSSVVTLFAFYPTSRHDIARHFPNRLWFSPCFVITALLSISAWLLLVSSAEKCMFAGLQLFLFVLSPCLQWWLQRYKKIITGNWDIAHINVK